MKNKSLVVLWILIAVVVLAGVYYMVSKSGKLSGVNNSAALINTTTSSVTTAPPPAVKVYRALISQVGTNDPTVDAVLENTTGGTVTYHRIAGGGRYYLSINNNAFTLGKTFATIGSTMLPCNTYITADMTAALVIGTMRNDNATSTQNDICLNKTPVEVLIYP